MTEGNKEEQRHNSVKTGKNMGEPLTGNIGGLNVAGGCGLDSGPGIEYHPHRPQGLQSAADMWIDKGRLTESLSKDEVASSTARKLLRQ